MAIKEFKLLPKQERHEDDYRMFEFDLSAIRRIFKGDSFFAHEIRFYWYTKAPASGEVGFSRDEFQEITSFSNIVYWSETQSTSHVGKYISWSLDPTNRDKLSQTIRYWSIEQLKHVSVGIVGLDIEGVGEGHPPYIIASYNVDEEKVLYDVAIDKERIDTIEPITTSWGSDAQDAFELQYVTGGATKTITGTTAKSYTFPELTLQPGSYTWKLRILANGGWGSDWVEGTPFEVYNGMKVTGLEPNRVAQNRDKDITIGWKTTHPQLQFELQYTINGNSKTITGDTVMQHVFSANTLPISTVNYKVRAYDGFTWSEWTNADFITFGTPAKPTLTIQDEYQTATPTFTWESVGQVSYRLQILEDDIITLDSGNVYSSTKQHTFSTFLDNNITYTAKLSISNQYEYASDYATKDFKIAFEELQKPMFDMFSDDKLGRILFNIYNAEGQTNFDYCELYRREYGEEKWLRVATNLPLIATYTDYTCRSGTLYEYKARAIAIQGGNTDSEVGLKEVKLRNTMLSDTADFDNYVVLIHNPKKGRVFTKETHVMNYNGTSKPWFEFGETRFQAIKVNFTVDEETLDRIFDLYYSNNILLFRDNRGKKLYGYIDGDIGVDDAEFMKYTVNFNFTETNYIEGVLV